MCDLIEGGSQAPDVVTGEDRVEELTLLPVLFACRRSIVMVDSTVKAVEHLPYIAGRPGPNTRATNLWGTSTIRSVGSGNVKY